MNRLWNAAPEILVALVLFAGIATVVVGCSRAADRFQPLSGPVIRR